MNDANPSNPEMLPVAQTLIDKLKVDLAQWDFATEEAERIASTCVIETDEQEANIADVLSRIKLTTGQIENARKMMGEPYRSAVETINGRMMPLTKRLGEAETLVKRKVIAFREAKQEALRREAEERRKAEEERIKKEMLERAAMGEEPSTTVTPKPVTQEVPNVQTQKTVGVGGGKLQGRKVWKFEVTEMNKVPRKYCTPNEKLIRAAVSAGEREIAGVRIWEETSIAAG